MNRASCSKDKSRVAMRLVLITGLRPTSIPYKSTDERRPFAIGPSVARCFPDPPVQTLCRKVQEVACGAIFACSIKIMLGRYREASKQASRKGGGSSSLARENARARIFFFFWWWWWGLRRRAEGTPGRWAAGQSDDARYECSWSFLALLRIRVDSKWRHGESI